jgi:nitrogenase subunit NifH
MFDARTNLSAEVAAEVRQHLGTAVFETVVPRSVRLAEAPSYGRPIATYAPDSRGAIAYRDLATEIWGRLDRDAGHLLEGEREASVEVGSSTTPDRSFALAVPRPQQGGMPAVGVPGGAA